MTAKPRYELKEVVLRLAEGRSLYSESQIRTAEDAVALMMNELADMDREYFCVVNMDTKGRPVNFNVVSIGSLTASIVDIPNVLKTCLLSNCKRFIAIHNHPSGDVTPSKEDLVVTRQIIAAARLLGMQCEDHVIVTDKSYLSIREQGYVSFTSEYRMVETMQMER